MPAVGEGLFGTFLTFLALSLRGFRTLPYWFEDQADDYAAARVGAADVVSALTWLNTKMFGADGSPWVNARIRRLQFLHELPA